MNKAGWFVFLLTIAVFSTFTCFAYGDAEDLRRIREKVGTGALSDSDVREIQGYIDDQLERMTYEVDYAKIAELRMSIVDQQGKSPSQYRLEYIRALKRSLNEQFNNLQAQANTDRNSYIKLNLMIIAAEMKSLDMTDFGLRMLSDRNVAIQYWAIKTIANPEIAKQLSSPVTGDAAVKTKIMSTLQSAVMKGLYSSSLSVVIDFLDEFDDKSANQLLRQIAERRIKDYESWSVDYELLEAKLLKTMAKKTIIANNVTERADCVRTFAQLYSYVIQRYIMGKDVLSDDSKLQLVSVIADVEQYAMGPGKFLDMSQNNMKQALIQQKMDVLQSEHDKLLGSANRVGRLCAELKFDYGEDAEGDPITAPKKLSKPQFNN